MTTKQFIAEATAYYGRYNEKQQEYVEKWLDARTDKQRAFIWAEVLKALSAKYGKPPVIKELEDAWRLIQRERWEELYPPALPEPVEDPVSPDEARQHLSEINRMLSRLSSAKRLRGKYSETA